MAEMHPQSELNFTRPDQVRFPTAKPDDPNVSKLLQVLLRADRWLTAAELCVFLDFPVDWNGKRCVRALAEAAAPEVLGDQDGYRHIDRATAAEIHHAAETLDARADKMKLRASRIRGRGHKLVG